jgi:hypothetical protein
MRSIRHFPLRRTSPRALLLSIPMACAIANTAACHRAALPPATTTLAAAAAATAASARAPEWAGTWELVGYDFPDGTRRARMVIARQASGELSLVMEQGPPGYLRAIEARGDSLHVRWSIADDGRESPLEVRLGAVGPDSVAGRWSMEEIGGVVEGRRVRD